MWQPDKHDYNGLAGEFWFSPDKLDAENRKGCFRWGVDNWQLRDPMERVQKAKERADAALDDYNCIREECLCPVVR